MSRRGVGSILDFASLKQGLPAITPAFGAALAESVAVCLDEQGHQSGVSLKLLGDSSGTFLLLYSEVTEQMRRCWNDREYATEQAAYGVALLLIQRLTEFTVIERSRRGTGFDYWLGKVSDVSEQPFQKLSRLEVSGIRQGSEQQIRTRVRMKIRQVQAVNNRLSVYVAVIEFSRPLAWVVRR
ncbi:hypothetical protein [cf. Phormidesmis sp. LEGE 11477]|uniref:hypothetical protein n=1 Tax=cf. Phormidesmis sp. LEGE 11477 TaxID=1828680 RepID=UPI00187EFD30|nr:hypothetical protein [cf. Phormidesmis sp. LEGE 11477]MBE9061231.1 hypothetical protein [cf. Phormidesmis sp. LEGE 11477]